jgi:amphi-Trp domain-containing protein
VSDVEVSRTETLTRHQAAEWLTKLATALAEGEKVELAMGASTLKVHVPDHVRCEIEVEIDGDEVELEMELKWSTAPARPARRNNRARKTTDPAGS